MASEAVHLFHKQQMEDAKKRVALIIANGTKASSPMVAGIRRQHPSFKGLPDNSTGSKNRPFFANKDESHISLEEKVAMRGGVLHTDAGKKFGYEILKRRARDVVNQQMALEGMPPMAQPNIELSKEDSMSLELDNLLSSIDEAIDVGDINGLTVNEMKNIPRLIVSLAPTFSEHQVVELIRFVEELIEKLNNMGEDAALRTTGVDDGAEDEEAPLEATQTSKRAERIETFFKRVLGFLEGLVRVVGRDEGAVKTAVKALSTKWFRGLRAPSNEQIIPPGERGDPIMSREAEQTPFQEAVEVRQTIRRRRPAAADDDMAALERLREQRRAAAAAAAEQKVDEAEEEEEEAAPTEIDDFMEDIRRLWVNYDTKTLARVILENNIASRSVVANRADSRTKLYNLIAKHFGKPTKRGQ